MRKLFILLSIAFWGCEPVQCFTPPEVLLFELVNKEGINLIESGDLSFRDILVRDKSSNSISDITLREDKYVILTEAGWFDGTKQFVFTTPIDTFELSITSSEIKSRKCGGNKIDGFSLNRPIKTELNVIKVTLNL